MYYKPQRGAIFRSHLPYVMSGCSTTTKGLIASEADGIAGQSLITVYPVYVTNGM